LFQSSEEHLDDIVSLLYSGRTSIKTTVEVGLNNQAKKECKE
jgi:hypothetical protein